MATTHIVPSQVQSQLGQQLSRRRRCSVDFNFTVPRFFFYFFHSPSRLQTHHSLGDRRHRRQQQLQQRGRSSSASSEHQIISPCPPLMEDHPQRQQLCSSETEQENRYSREMDVAVRAVQMACWICQKVQDTLVFQTHDNNSSSGSSSNNSQVHSKDDNSPVTIADWSVQATISWLLSEHFKSENVSIAAEEDVHALSKADGAGLLKAVVKTVNEALCDAPRFGLMGPEKNLDAMQVLDAISRCRSTGTLARRFWALDPVDGTLGFVRGDQYAVALSLIEDGKVVLGVLGCPNYPMRKEWLNYHHRYHRIITKLTLSTSESWDRGCVLYAREGSGEAWMQPLLHKSKSLEWPNSAVPVRVSPVDNPASATFCEPVEKANSSHSFTAGLAHSVGLRKQPLRVYSMVKYAAIARGDAEIFMKFARAGYKEKIWDHAAGVVIVQEAGGVVTDARGRPLDFSRGIFLEGLDRGIIACSGSKLHERIIKAVDASWDSSCL